MRLVLIFFQKCTPRLPHRSYLEFLYRKQLCSPDVFLFSVSEQVSRTVVGNRSRIMATYLTFGFVAILLRTHFQLLRTLCLRNPIQLRCFLIPFSHYMMIFHRAYFVTMIIVTLISFIILMSICNICNNVNM